MGGRASPRIPPESWTSARIQTPTDACNWGLCVGCLVFSEEEVNKKSMRLNDDFWIFLFVLWSCSGSRLSPSSLRWR